MEILGGRVGQGGLILCLGMGRVQYSWLSFGGRVSQGAVCS